MYVRTSCIIFAVNFLYFREFLTPGSLEHFIHNHWQGEFTKEQKIWLITSITKQLLQLVCDLQRKGVCVAAQVQNSINSKLAVCMTRWARRVISVWLSIDY